MGRKRKRRSGDWKKVVHINEGTGPHGGRYWSLKLECGHFKAVRIPPFRIGRLLSHRPPSPPQRVRCLICGADKKSIEKLLDETYKSMAVLARKIEAGDEAAREPWEKLNKQAQQLERKIGAALEAEYADEIKEAKEMDELLGRIDTILAEDETD